MVWGENSLVIWSFGYELFSCPFSALMFLSTQCCILFLSLSPFFFLALSLSLLYRERVPLAPQMLSDVVSLKKSLPLHHKHRCLRRKHIYRYSLNVSRRLTAQERVWIFKTINHLLCLRSALDLLRLKQLQITVLSLLCIFFYFTNIIWSDKHGMTFTTLYTEKKKV